MFQKLFNKLGYWLISDKIKDTGEFQDVRVNYSGSIGSAARVKASHDINNVNGMHFTIFSATGGKVVQFNTYDPSRDRSDTRLYIVTEKDNLGEELAQIITRESLTR